MVFSPLFYVFSSIYCSTSTLFLIVSMHKLSPDRLVFRSAIVTLDIPILYLEIQIYGWLPQNYACQSELSYMGIPSSNQLCLHLPFEFQHFKACELGDCDKPLYITCQFAFLRLGRVCHMCYFTYILSLSLQANLFPQNFSTHSIPCAKQSLYILSMWSKDPNSIVFSRLGILLYHLIMIHMVIL